MIFKTLPVIALVLSCTASADLLLDRMAGSWSGEGERTQLASGHVTQIKTQTDAVLKDGVLQSHNTITETDAQTKTYVRDYWVRPAASGAAGDYDLGAGARTGSHGHFDGTVFVVEQDLGGYRVRSRTLFDEQGSTYEQSDWYGDHELSRTQIRYRR